MMHIMSKMHRMRRREQSPSWRGAWNWSGRCALSAWRWLTEGSGWWKQCAMHWEAMLSFICIISGWLAYFSFGKDLLVVLQTFLVKAQHCAAAAVPTCWSWRFSFPSAWIQSLVLTAAQLPGFSWISIFIALDIGFQTEVETSSLLKSHRKSAAVCTVTLLIPQLLIRHCQLTLYPAFISWCQRNAWSGVALLLLLDDWIQAKLKWRRKRRGCDDIVAVWKHVYIVIT